MIISRVIGGLGNQMFQYAALRAIEIRTGLRCKIDISAFNVYGLHQGFELNKIFSVPINVASGSEKQSILGWRANPKIFNQLLKPKFKLLRPSNFIIESDINCPEEIFNPKDPSYLAGYWQSEKYFLDFSSQIRKDFSFSEQLSARNKAIQDRINLTNSISLHIRRGDYVTNSTAFAIHGVCSISYYLNAIEYIKGRIESPVFFIFSDDLDWVKSNLKIENSAIYVEHNKDSESYNDMRLMSMCKHHIIANSSFSWWGAWLNSSTNKIVICPKRWFSGKNTVPVDLIPKSWRSL